LNTEISKVAGDNHTAAQGMLTYIFQAGLELKISSL